MSFSRFVDGLRNAVSGPCCCFLPPVQIVRVRAGKVDTAEKISETVRVREVDSPSGGHIVDDLTGDALFTYFLALDGFSF